MAKRPYDPVSEVRPTDRPATGDPVARHEAMKSYGQRVTAAEGRQDRKSAVTYTRSPANWRPYDEAS